MQFFKNSNTAKLWYTIALVIVLIPTYFIHTQKYPDWGDDFAQYVYQAQQIHTPSKVYKEVLNVEEYSSSKRSLFFSIVLSVLIPNDSIHGYVNVVSVFYILAAIVCFIFFSHHFTLLVSFFATLCVFYNFLFLRLKSEVVPEFLFIAIFLLILYLVNQAKSWLKCFIPALIALLISTRFVGLSIFLGYILHLLLNRTISLKDRLKEVAFSVCVLSAIIFLINTFCLSSVANREVALYGTYVTKHISINTIADNVMLYSKYITLFFEQEIPFWTNYVIKFIVSVLFIIGFIYSVLKKRTVIEWTFIFYFLFLFIYPYNGDTIKYLIPIFPLFIHYVVFALGLLLTQFLFQWRSQLVLSGLGIILLSNSKTIWLSINRAEENVGPYESSVLNDFEMIKKIVPDSKNIAFGKPFIVSLLMDRHSYFLSQTNYSDILNKADYALISKPNINELYPKTIGVKIAKGDTTELTNFYLVKL